VVRREEVGEHRAADFRGQTDSFLKKDLIIATRTDLRHTVQQAEESNEPGQIEPIIIERRGTRGRGAPQVQIGSRTASDSRGHKQ
jgi:hypothetical protein